MSPKSKTQKRKEQRKKQTNGPSNSAVSQMRLNEQRNEIAALKMQVSAFLKHTGLQQPAPASEKSMVDEKYIKVPDAAELELQKVADIVTKGKFLSSDGKSQTWAITVPSSGDGKPYKGGNQITESLAALKEILATPVVDAKEVAMKTAMHRLKQRGHNGGRYGMLKPFSTTVVVKYAATVTATANTTVHTVKPGAWADFLVFKSVFDMARVKSLVIRSRFHCTTTGTGQPTTPGTACDYSVAWDPENSGAYSAVEQPLEAPYHTGPHSMTGFYATMVLEKDQEWHVRKIPTTFASTNSTTMSDLVGGGWFDPNDQNMIIGYIKPYGESPGSSKDLLLEHYVIAHCEFASRT